MSMRVKTPISARMALAALALVLLASSPLAAAPPTVNFEITGVGSGGSLDGVYTSPYAGTVNGIATPVICDDFANNSYVPEYWTAYDTSLSSLTNSNDSYLKWNNAIGTANGHSWDLSQKTAYDVLAYLAIELDSSPAASTTSEDLSYAMWELFDATGASGTNLNSNSDQVVSWLNGYGDSTTLTNATNDVLNAISEICTTGGGCTTTGGVESVNGAPTVLNGWNINIYTIPVGDQPTCPDNTGGICGSAPPQEFITVPESSSVPAFAVYFLFGGASLLLFSRRRVFKG